MPSCRLTVPNRLGLHARAAMKLSDLAARYQSKITILHNNRQLDVKDIMKLLTLGASQKTVLEFHFEGADEQAAEIAIKNLFADNFNESE